MLDIELIREHTEWVKEQIRYLQDETALQHVDNVVELDHKRRQLISEAQTLKEARNIFSKGAGKLRGDKKLDDAARLAAAVAATEALQTGDLQAAKRYLQDPSSAPSTEESDLDEAFNGLFGTLKELGNRVSEMDEQIRDVDAQLEKHMLWIPNMPHESTPRGAGEEDNIPHEPEGEMRSYDFIPKPHWELGPQLDIIDFERGIKIQGSRGYIIRSQGARLYRALINWMLDEHVKRGYEEVYLPFMVKEEALVGSAQFPKFRDNVYHDRDAQLYLIPTAEVALTNMFADEILQEEDLPFSFVAHTPCFRREKMSAGRDVRGIKRVHQFEKVEMYKFTVPETSYQAMEEITQGAEHIARALHIPFRRLEIVTGDLGFSASKKYDLEMYAPGVDEWLEVSSVSNTEAFQARRANVRYRPKEGGKPKFVHTLNGSGLGMTRVLIAIMENYQQKDGSVRVPDVVVPYMGGVEVIEPKG